MKIQTVVKGPKLTTLPAGKYTAEVVRAMPPTEGKTRMGVIYRIVSYDAGKSMELADDVTGWELTDWIDIQPDQIENDWVQRRERTKLLQFLEAFDLSEEWDTEDLNGQQVHLIVEQKPDQFGVPEARVKAYQRA